MGGALHHPHIASHIIQVHIPSRYPRSRDARDRAHVHCRGDLQSADSRHRRALSEAGTSPAQTDNTDFADCFNTLWHDKLGQISLAVTRCFWGAGATLQFMCSVGEVSLGMSCRKPHPAEAIIAVGGCRRYPRGRARTAEEVAVRAAVAS